MFADSANKHPTSSGNQWAARSRLTSPTCRKLAHRLPVRGAIRTIALEIHRMGIAHMTTAEAQEVLAAPAHELKFVCPEAVGTAGKVFHVKSAPRLKDATDEFMTVLLKICDRFKS